MTSRDRYRFISNYPIQRYRCGLKAGDRVRLKQHIRVRNHKGRFTGEVYQAGEIWTVLPGAEEEPRVVWFCQANGKRHTWDDDPSIFETFELVRSSTRTVKKRVTH